MIGSRWGWMHQTVCSLVGMGTTLCYRLLPARRHGGGRIGKGVFRVPYVPQCWCLCMENDSFGKSFKRFGNIQFTWTFWKTYITMQIWDTGGIMGSLTPPGSGMHPRGGRRRGPPFVTLDVIEEIYGLSLLCPSCRVWSLLREQGGLWAARGMGWVRRGGRARGKGAGYICHQQTHPPRLDLGSIFKVGII